MVLFKYFEELKASLHALNLKYFMTLDYLHDSNARLIIKKLFTWAKKRSDISFIHRAP